MYGGGSDPAGAARKQELEREAAIRTGQQQIDAIFSGTHGVNPVTADTFDPSGTYYNQYGAAWAPSLPADNILRAKYAQLYPTRKLPPPKYGEQVPPPAPGPKISFDQYKNSLITQQAQDAIKAGTLFSGVNTSGGFDDQFYADRAKAFEGYALPQEQQQYNQTKNTLAYNLANKGILSSSAAVNSGTQLTRYAGQQERNISDEALNESNNLRQQVQDQKNQLTSQLIASGDPSVSATSALGAVAQLRAPTGFAPLGNMFGDFTNMYLTNQAAAAYNPGYGGAPNWSFGGGGGGTGSSRIVA